MLWVEAFALFAVCHLVGDFLLQTDWQAVHKSGGLGSDPVSRRALFSHVSVYTLCFVPALAWLASRTGVGAAAAIAVGAAIFVTHLIQDDGRLLAAYARKVKGMTWEPGALAMSVDQSFHMLVLLGLAIAIGA